MVKFNKKGFIFGMYCEDIIWTMRMSAGTESGPDYRSELQVVMNEDFRHEALDYFRIKMDEIATLYDITYDDAVILFKTSFLWYRTMATRSRIAKLKELGAPQMIIDNEEASLVEHLEFAKGYQM